MKQLHKTRLTISREFLIRQGSNLAHDILGSVAYAIGVYTFASNAGFAPGGIAGIGVIFNYLFNLPIGLIVLAFNVPVVLIALKYLGKRYLLRTFQTLLINALFLDLLAPMFPRYAGSPLLAALFGGGISGLGLAIIYSAGSCTGGSDLIIMSLRKMRPHLSVGQITLLIDGSLILLGAFIYSNIDAVLYGIVFTFASTFVIDRYMGRMTSGKMVLIISRNGQEIGARILKEPDRGVTRLSGQGMYSGENKDVLMCACTRSQLPGIRQIVAQSDTDAIMIIMDFSEVHSRGFLPYKE